MTFDKYLRQLNAYAEANPKSLELEAIYAKDDEGNGYGHTHYSPSMVEYDGEDVDPESETPNAVVIN